MLDEYPDLLDFKQMQEILHVGKNLLLNQLNNGEIPAFRIGRLWRISKKDLINYINRTGE